MPVPDGVAPEHAAFATVGAIAMQASAGPRSSSARPRASSASAWSASSWSGCWSPPGSGSSASTCCEDRCRLAEKAGALLRRRPTDEGLAAVAAGAGRRSPSGRGADHVLLAAGGSSNGPVEAAARLARDRARVVDIGKTRLDLPWNAYYDKELDVRFSRSYGPGRYDDRYELEGIDYPAGYVRWTERRNLECFLDLIAREEIEVASLVSGVFPLDEAPRRSTPTWRPARWPAVGVLLEYPAPAADASEPPATSQLLPGGRAGRARGRRGQASWPSASSAPATTRSSMLLPHLARLDTVAAGARRHHPVAVGGQRAAQVRLRAPPRPTPTRCSSDESLDAIFIVTRHHTHAELVCRALETGKAVFVEKPLALTRDELQRDRRDGRRAPATTG